MQLRQQDIDAEQVRQIQMAQLQWQKMQQQHMAVGGVSFRIVNSSLANLLGRVLSFLLPVFSITQLMYEVGF